MWGGAKTVRAGEKRPVMCHNKQNKRTFFVLVTHVFQQLGYSIGILRERETVQA